MANLGLTFRSDHPGNVKVKIKTENLLKSVSKGVIKVLAGNHTGAVAELPDIVVSLGVKASPEQRVGALVVGALERALVVLTAEIMKERDDLSPDIWAASFIGLSDGLEFSVDQKFFENPRAAGIIGALQLDATRWLKELKISDNDIYNILERMPTVFVRSLHEEWRAKASFYGAIHDVIDSPFNGAALMEEDWERYRAYLMAQVEERVFDESFSLRQIYLEPRCFYYKKHDTAARTREFTLDDTARAEPFRELRWLHSEVDSWIEQQDRDFAILTVAGGPGSGKSSFAKIFASHLADHRVDVLFVPLYQVDLESGISRSLAEFFGQSGFFASDPLDVDSDRPIILILDGLDEIQMQGRAAQESAQNFVDDLIRYIDRRNANSCRILCLVTGRDIAVESAEGALRLEGQVLYIAPYSLSKNEMRYYGDVDEIFNIDQRDEWWQRYGVLTSENFSEMPKNLRNGELNEVTSQPLLNYLVALSYRQGIALDEKTNVNSVYEDLLRAVYERSWARHGHPSVKDVPYDSFVRLLEEVAISVWHGAGRTTTLAEVELHCQQSKVGALLPSLQSGVSSGVSSLLLAFYFRQKGRRDDGQKTFEFTHKTFSEYLTAHRIVRLIELVCTQMQAHNDDPDQGIDDKDALHRWLAICGQTALDPYLLQFIRREIASRGNTSAVLFQDSLSRLLTAALRGSWPVERIEKLTFSEQQRYVRNAEETLLACLNACARVSRRVSSVEWVGETGAGEMIRRLQGQRKGPPNRPVMSCLSYMNYDEQYLDMADLYRANMANSSFCGTHLNYTMMMQANLRGSTFLGAQFQDINWRDAILKGAKLPLDELRRTRASWRQIFGVGRRRISGAKVAENERSSVSYSNLRRFGFSVVDKNGDGIKEKILREEFREGVKSGRDAPTKKVRRKN